MKSKPDEAIRDRLENWAAWQNAITLPGPGKINSSPMFREYRSGYKEEDADHINNRIGYDAEDALYLDKCVAMLDSHHKSVIKRYFIETQNVVKCSKQAKMSQRQFEKWLNQAIGKVEAYVELFQLLKDTA